jgi:hypothetical protein
MESVLPDQALHLARPYEKVAEKRRAPLHRGCSFACCLTVVPGGNGTKDGKSNGKQRSRRFASLLVRSREPISQTRRAGPRSQLRLALRGPLVPRPGRGMAAEAPALHFQGSSLVPSATAPRKNEEHPTRVLFACRLSRPCREASRGTNDAPFGSRRP